MRDKISIPPLERACEHCGSPFRTWPNMIRRGFGRFCGRPCGNEHRKVAPEARFWPKVARIDDADSCWEWQAQRDEDGYGKLWVNEVGHSVPAHRFSFELHNGPVPDDVLILHRCDNPPCVRPDHLFAGTPLDNMLDKMAKGRGLVGEQHPNAKLTWDAVREIRRRAENGESAVVLSREFGIHLRNTFKVIGGSVWCE